MGPPRHCYLGHLEILAYLAHRKNLADLAYLAHRKNLADLVSLADL
jgi:hypothetical protein